MKTLATLNLNKLTVDQESRREHFYRVLKALEWEKVSGSKLSTTWSIQWTAGSTTKGADTAIRSDLNSASDATGIPKSKIECLWAHDPDDIRQY